LVGGGDVPVGTALSADGAKVLAKLFQRGAAKEPVAIVDFEDDQPRLENDGGLCWIGVLDDVEILLNYPSGIR
jgi:hypothetical protein